MDIDLDAARATFHDSTDFTIGIEEEFQLLDPVELALVPRFAEFKAAAQADQVLAEAIAGELIESEIEIRSGRGETFADALNAQRDRRRRLFALVSAGGGALATTGTHPFADYREQRIIDTAHYRRLDHDLGYVAWRNNTFSLHVHVGVRDADRAVRVCDRLRPVLPVLLAISANSPFLEGRDTRLASARSQIFTRSFPRCGIPEAFGSWEEYARYISFLVDTRSIIEYTQVWWSVRPHFAFGTVEVRICDAQSTAHESEAVAGLIAASIAQAALDLDAGVEVADPPARLIEENMWRAIRYGLDGELIDLGSGEVHPTAAAAERLLRWTEPARTALGIDVALPARNGAQRQRDRVLEGQTIRESFAASVAEARATFPGAVRVS
jgi:carboxylate-amine ligase